MGSLIKIDPINKDTLDDRIKSFDERLNVLFDYTKTDFTIMSYDNSRKLFFSKCQESKITAEVITTYKDYHDDIAKFFDENTKNIAKGLIENTEIFSMIVDVVFVPELVAVNFITAGYVIGMSCVDAVYGSNKSESVDYVVGHGNVESITGQDLTLMADKYLLNDIEVASRLGYMYYHKTASGFRNTEKKEQRLAQNDMRRFGNASNINSVTALMRNMTSFVPIGFRWSSYTPFIFKDERFFNRLKNETVLGYDMVEVPNFLKRDYASRGISSETIYTTKKRLHKILNTEVDFYNFSFLYKILAGLYLVDRYYCAAGTVYINKETRQLCSQIEYSVMNKVDKDMCILVDNADAAKYASSKLVKMYVSSMILMYNSVEQEQSIKEIAGSLAKLTMETIYADVISDTEISTDMFGYVV